MPRRGARSGPRASHQQLHRLSLGFDPATGVTVAGMGGRIPGVINNDIGVVTFPNRHRYAAAVFTRADHAFAGELASYPIGRGGCGWAGRVRSGRCVRCVGPGVDRCAAGHGGVDEGVAVGAGLCRGQGADGAP